MKKIIMLASIIALTVACGQKVDYNNECGSLEEFEIDEDYCRRYGLREESFKLKYPSDLDVETQEDYRSNNYVSFVKYGKDTTIIEAVNIGFYYGLNESGGDGIGDSFGLTKKSLLTSIINQYKAQGIDIKNVTMKDENIRGEQHFTVRGAFQTTENIAGFDGNYLIQKILIETGTGHGLLFVMTARDDSDILSFEDFETKGCISPILQSIH